MSTANAGESMLLAVKLSSLETVRDKHLQSGNPCHVYDGSDFTRYKKLAAINKNYNDKSFGVQARQVLEAAVCSLHWSRPVAVI